MKEKLQKVDCCSNGGAGWGARRRDRLQCEPCKTSVEGIHHISFMSFHNGSRNSLRLEGNIFNIYLCRQCTKRTRTIFVLDNFESLKTETPYSIELLVLLKVDAK